MTDANANPPGIITLNNCVPIGNLVIYNVTAGNIIERDWTFRVNGAITFDSLLNSGSILNSQIAGNSTILDPRNLAHGTDGRLMIIGAPQGGLIPGVPATEPASQGFGELASVQEFTIAFNIHSVDVQPLGMHQVWAIPTGFDATLTLKEFVINDEVLLRALVGRPPDTAGFFSYLSKPRVCDVNVTFQGRIESRLCQ